MPDFADLNKLPLRAIVVLALRSARRVQPLYLASDVVPDSVKEAYDRALTGVDSFCRGDDKSAEVAFQEMQLVSDEAPRQGNVIDGDPAIYSLEAAAGAVLTAYEALLALRKSRETGDAPQPVGAYYKVEGAVVEAARAADVMRSSALFRPGEEQDFAQLIERAQRERWTDTTTVDPDSVGVMWPKGVPTWFREATLVSSVKRAVDHEPAPKFVIVWDPEILDDDEYAEIVTALGDAVRESGGKGVRRIGSQSIGLPVSDGVTT